jgi:amino acid adenylation domain-containing protein
VDRPAAVARTGRAEQRPGLAALSRMPTIEEAIRRHADSRPGAVALTDGTTQVTYRQLDWLSERLAIQMTDAGIGPEVVVAVRTRRKLAAAIAFLAVLKSGGMYLPLEWNAPPDRTEQLLRDSRAAAIVVDEEALHVVSEIPRLRVDLHPGNEKPRAPRPSRHDAQPRCAAYLIYTSGTTGAPKGVCVERAGLLSHLKAVVTRLGLVPGDRILHFSPVHVDTAVEQVLGTLLVGATVVVSEETRTIASMTGFLTEQGVTVADLATGYWHLMADGLEWRRWPGNCVRLMQVGGDKMTRGAAARWLTRTGVALLNAYGPTEAIITSTLHDVVSVTGGDPPIGDAVGDRALYVLDQELNACARGQVGELHIGGSLLARGYLRRPSQTARSFIPDPFTGRQGARMYRTGDLVRALPGGGIEFVGRVDDQVKIGGYRVEPGEVESVLASHSHVRACAVVARQDPAGRPLLAAYVVTTSRLVGADALRAHLATRLPAYMVPAVISVVDAIPLTSNNKVDRVALRNGRLDTGSSRTALTEVQ